MITITNKDLNEMAQFLEMGQKVFLNKKTGEIKQLADRDNPYYEGEFWDEEYDEIDENHDDYIQLEKMDSRDEYQIMENFVHTVQSKKTRERFIQALNGHKPFRNFKHQVDNSDERQNWFDFRTQTYMNFVRKQLSHQLKDTQIVLEEAEVTGDSQGDIDFQPASYFANSIRSFIGTKDFEESRQFYLDLGFEESIISDSMSLFSLNDDLVFYLQKQYLKDSVDNMKIFLEVDDLDECYADMQERGLQNKYEQVKLSPIKNVDWGRECFLNDPSGVLWHFGEFE